MNGQSAPFVCQALVPTRMRPDEAKQLRLGTTVRHKVTGMVGRFDGVTHMKHLFELPTDSIGCRIRVFGDQTRLVASPDNIESLEGYSIEERHQFNLAYFGRPSAGIRRIDLTSQPQRRRVTVCWCCKENLDNAVDVECVACGWILCPCGACGCGYSVKGVDFS